MNEAASRFQPKEGLLDETRRAWQPYADRELTREDAREIIHNIVGYFDLLHEWDVARKK